MSLKNKRKFLIIFILVFLITLTVEPNYVESNAVAHMQLTELERIELAKSNYHIFAEKPNDNFEVLISFSNSEAIPHILKDQNNIISAFHYFEFKGYIVSGGYTDCENKNINEVIDTYYVSIYDLILSQIDVYDEYIEFIKGNNSSKKEMHIFESEYAYKVQNNKMIDKSPIEVYDTIKEEGVSLEQRLNNAQASYRMFLQQKEAMDNGEFNIYGVRLIMKGKDITTLLNNSSIKLVENLNFDNNNLITPIK